MGNTERCQSNNEETSKEEYGKVKTHKSPSLLVGH